MSEKFITIYRNLNRAPVEVVKAILEDHGIPCMVKGADTMRPHLQMWSGVELQINEKDKEKAEKLLKDLKEEIHRET